MFHYVGWIVYYKRLNGFDKYVSLELSENLDNDRSIMKDIQIYVTKEGISMVMVLSQKGK